MKLPKLGIRVVVTRKDGERIIARRDRKPDAVCFNPDKVLWLDDNNKVLDVPFNPVISWAPLTGE